MKLLIVAISSLLFASPWDTQENGPHSVGYKVFNKYDYGRSTMPPYDFEGNKYQGERAIPIQISMWYPAEMSAGARMKFQDYVYITRERHDFIPLTDEEKAQSIEVLKFPAQFGAGIELTDEQLRDIYSQNVMATRDAPAKVGKFPLILAASDGGPSNQPALFEHLASLGYIVLFTPSIERDATRQVNAPQHVLIDRINNLEYLLSFARTIPSADLDKIGTIGVNFDGMTALLYQMKSGEARAVVSIDGWEGKAGSEKILQSSIYYDPVAFKIPFFTVLQDEKNPPPGLMLSQNIFNSLLYADRYYYVFKNMGHAHLLSNLYALPMLPAENRQSYNYLFTSIGKFFDGNLKGDTSAKKFLSASSVENGLADHAKVELKKNGLAPVPSSAELESMIMAGEIDKVKRIAKDALKGNPELQLIEFSALNLYNFRFTRSNRPELCVAIRELGVQLFPKSTQAMELLGDAQSAFGKPEDAKKSYQQALKMIDPDPFLTPEAKNGLRQSIAAKIK